MMQDKINFVWILGCILVLLFSATTYAAQRIFYEDCEDTNFQEYFLERHYGTHYKSYWSELTTELTRSSIAHRGSFSMTYDPFAAGNPHAVVGVGNVPYGNTSNFNLRDYSGRYWYFRWYQRWEKNIDWGGYNVKLLYINYQDTPDFATWVWRTAVGSDHALVETLKDYDTYTIQSSTGGIVQSNPDDEKWHKIEYILDVGVNGVDNGRIILKMDDVVYVDESNVHFNNTITNHPIGHITGWPSNLSGSGGSGTARTWLDDLEIYILDGPDDIPPELGSEAYDDLPTVAITYPSSPTFSTSSSTINISGTSSDDNGVTSITWSNSTGGSGTVTGDLTAWTATGIHLQEGENVITVTCQDTAGQTSTDQVTISYALASVPGAPQDFDKE